ncbi:MAG: glycerophosphodiester phosphodiesterase [Anaerolineae bacterium]|nr:glycerophosphodiester phosphodiesterase [Anaerolineae bacterium]
MARFPDFWRYRHPLIFAHRGACREAPENTLPAFRRAVEIGAQGVELDVHLSADGAPVVIHNDTVDAVTDGTGRVGELPLDVLQALDAGAHFSPAFAGTRIPTLEEVLDEVGNQVLVNIELKAAAASGNALESAVADLVRRMGLEQRVWVSSFKPYALFQMRTLAPQLPCGLLYGPLSPGARLMAPVTPHEALHPHWSLVSGSSVRRAHRRGLRVVVWTVDDGEAALRLAGWGVDVLITNTPAEIAAALSLGDDGAVNAAAAV